LPNEEKALKNRLTLVYGSIGAAASSVALSLSSVAWATHAPDRPINTASELRDWCREESEQALVAKGMSPFNWTASYSDAGDILSVKGRWRIDVSAVAVECHIARGDAARSATMSLQDEGAGGT
jgi:hypothetical protein